MKIRAARGEDVPELIRLLAQLDGYHAEIQPGFFRAGPRTPEELGRELAGRHHVYLVAEEAGRLLGAGSVRVYDTPAHPLMVPARRAMLQDMIVETGARRRGVGRRLVEAARAWSQEQGASVLLLTVWAGNEAALGFYGAMGLEPVSQVLGMPVE